MSPLEGDFTNRAFFNNSKNAVNLFSIKALVIIRLIEFLQLCKRLQVFHYTIAVEFFSFRPFKSEIDRSGRIFYEHAANLERFRLELLKKNLKYTCGRD